MLKCNWVDVNLCKKRASNVLTYLYNICWCLKGSQMQVSAHSCLVGQERDLDNKWRWVLPYENPCACTSVMTGGVNFETPERSFDPVYVNSSLRSDNINEIRNHFNINCQGKVLIFHLFVPRCASHFSNYIARCLTSQSCDQVMIFKLNLLKCTKTGKFVKIKT